MEEYMKSEQVDELAAKIKSGDNEAWEKLYHNFENYIYKCVNILLSKFNMANDGKNDVKDELRQAGWQGFSDALHNYDPQKGKLLTYATGYIKGEMLRQMRFILNPLGLTEKPNNIARVQLESVERLRAREPGISVSAAPKRGKYSAERRALQIMEILRLLTDEKHSLSKDKLCSLLQFYRIVKYNNGTPLESPNTITSTIEEILSEVDPPKYTGNNDDEYMIKYEGYKEDRLQAKQNKERGEKAAAITEFSYAHLFDHEELDRLVQIVCLSDMLSGKEKTDIVNKLVSTASVYYRTPFLQGGKLKFSPKAVHGRFSGKMIRNRRGFSRNINIIQNAVNNMWQIRFKFNCYTAEHEMIPKSDYVHVLSPYHLVVYHDNYYCIGLKADDKRIWHYRVDLMTDIEFVKNDNGRNVPIAISAFGGLPISSAYWDPEKYMAEHLYMAYDEPRDINIKIRNTDYTILHDWFGDHYDKTDEPCEDGYDIVTVRTSPSMIVHWAMQYAGAVEIMDEEIRGKIRDEIKNLQEKYKK